MHAVVANLLHSRATRVLIVLPPHSTSSSGTLQSAAGSQDPPEPFDEYEDLEVWPTSGGTSGSKGFMQWRQSVGTHTARSPTDHLPNRGSRTAAAAVSDGHPRAQSPPGRGGSRSSGGIGIPRSSSAASLREVGLAAGAAARGMTAWWGRLLHAARSRTSDGILLRSCSHSPIIA